MKVLSMYLPQFHRTKENDAWWGEGFTEWTAVRRAKPLFEGHDEPRKPLDDNYYNLLDKETMQWQAALMRKYGIDGQVFYHYYFRDGRKILEKPAENLLKWQDIDMPFCFSWANESWIRSWSNIYGVNGNAWFDSFDKQSGKTEGSGILLEQSYGGRREWDEHFRYLLPFFKDRRYICYEGKPVFLIYRAGLIPCLKDMLERWRELAKQNGLPGLYLITTYGDRAELFDNTLLQEPQSTLRELELERRDGLPGMKDYTALCQTALSRRPEPNTCLSAFPGYDDTPRRGTGGTAVTGSSPELFALFLEHQLEKAQSLQSPFFFINAWNEWGEGMYLEPDKRYGFGYLRAVRDARKVAALSSPQQEVPGAAKPAGCAVSSQTDRKIQKYRGYWEIMDRWLSMHDNGTSPADLLKERGITSISLYGVGMLGMHLVKDLQANGIAIEYGVDRMRYGIDIGFRVYSPDEELPETECMIITVPSEFESIRSTLAGKVKGELLNIGELILSWGTAE